ncbi:MAG: hypothetical protein ACM30G_09615, partial [Micromonosporaceae bacterium]
LRRQLTRARLLVFVGLIFMSVPPVALPLMRLAYGAVEPQPTIEVPEDQPTLGSDAPSPGVTCDDRAAQAAQRPPSTRPSPPCGRPG